jgi:hypothetical protein
MNDGSPNPAADGVGGPFMKIKAANGKPCLGSMNASTNCFDTLSYLTKEGAQASLRSQSYNDPTWSSINFNHPSGAESWPTTLPAPFASSYPFTRGSNFPEVMLLTLIVKDGVATLLFYDGDTPVATRASLPASYSGGKVGFL